jgi:hypothetical protein
MPGAGCAARRTPQGCLSPLPEPRAPAGLRLLTLNLPYPRGGRTFQFGPGAVLGSADMFLDGPARFRAVAAARCRVLRLSESGLHRLAAERPRVRPAPARRRAAARCAVPLIGHERRQRMTFPLFIRSLALFLLSVLVAAPAIDSRQRALCSAAFRPLSLCRVAAEQPHPAVAMLCSACLLVQACCVQKRHAHQDRRRGHAPGSRRQPRRQRGGRSHRRGRRSAAARADGGARRARRRRSRSWRRWCARSRSTTSTWSTS